MSSSEAKAVGPDLSKAEELAAKLRKTPNYPSFVGDLHTIALEALITVAMAQEGSGWTEERRDERNKELEKLSEDMRVIEIQVGLEIMGPRFEERLFRVLEDGEAFNVLMEQEKEAWKILRAQEVV